MTEETKPLDVNVNGALFKTVQQWKYSGLLVRLAKALPPNENTVVLPVTTDYTPLLRLLPNNKTVFYVLLDYANQVNWVTTPHDPKRTIVKNEHTTRVNLFLHYKYVDCMKLVKGAQLLEMGDLIYKPLAQALLLHFYYSTAQKTTFELNVGGRLNQGTWASASAKMANVVGDALDDFDPAGSLWEEVSADQIQDDTRNDEAERGQGQ